MWARPQMPRTQPNRQERREIEAEPLRVRAARPCLQPSMRWRKAHSRSAPQRQSLPRCLAYSRQACPRSVCPRAYRSCWNFTGMPWSVRACRAHLRWLISCTKVQYQQSVSHALRPGRWREQKRGSIRPQVVLIDTSWTAPAKYATSSCRV